MAIAGSSQNGRPQCEALSKKLDGEIQERGKVEKVVGDVRKSLADALRKVEEPKKGMVSASLVHSSP